MESQSKKKEIDMLESVSHRATRLVPGLKKESYEVRFSELNLESGEKEQTLLNYNFDLNFIKF